MLPSFSKMASTVYCTRWQPALSGFSAVSVLVPCLDAQWVNGQGPLLPTGQVRELWEEVFHGLLLKLV